VEGSVTVEDEAVMLIDEGWFAVAALVVLGWKRGVVERA
jgi:hypothetical protein